MDRRNTKISDKLQRTRFRKKIMPVNFTNKLMHKLFYEKPQLDLDLWPGDHISGYKLNKNDKAGTKYLPQTHEDEPHEKKKKLSDETDKTALKLVLSRDGESDIYKSKFEATVTNTKENSENNSKISDTKKYYKNNETKNNENNFMNYTSTTIETIHENIDFNNEPVKMISQGLSIIRKWHRRNNGQIAESRVPSPLTPPIYIIKLPELSIHEIETLYKKYFSESTQNDIVIITNILNLISISNKHHKEKMYEATKKVTTAEQFKEQYHAYVMHKGHKQILNSKLKKYFLNVITEFSIPEFEHAFQMFFISLLTIQRVLDRPILETILTFSKEIILLFNSLKNSGQIDNDGVFEMLNSKYFLPNCIDLMTFIEENRKSNSSMTDRMPIFFVSSVNSEKYFQVVINAMTSVNNDDLGLLIDNAAVQYRMNSTFKISNQPSLSTAKKDINLKAPASATQTSLKNDYPIIKIDNRCVLSNTSNEHFLSTFVIDPKSNTKSPTTLENGKPIQHLNSSYKSLSNNIASDSSLKIESASNGVSSILEPGGIVTSPNIPGVSPQTGPTSVTVKPANQVNQLRGVNATHTTTQNAVVNTPVSTVRRSKGTPVQFQCFGKNCSRVATITCDYCKAAKYCDAICKSVNWHEAHSEYCEGKPSNLWCLF